MRLQFTFEYKIYLPNCKHVNTYLKKGIFKIYHAQYFTLLKGPAPATSRSMPPRHRSQPHVEEAIEIENNEEPTAPEEEPKQSSRSSSTTLSNKSTASLIRDDSPEDGPATAADNTPFDQEDKAPSPPPAYSSPPPPEPEPSNAKSTVSLKDLSPPSPTSDSDLNSSQISVKPLIEEDEESKV